MSLKQLIENQTEWLIRLGVPRTLVEEAVQITVMHCWEESALNGTPVDEVADNLIATRRLFNGHDFLPPKEP